MNRMMVVRGDITEQRTDAIVNAANSSLMGGGGVDGAIHHAGRPEILHECRQYVSRYGSLPVGQAMITGGGNLPARFVIHTVGPVWNGGNNLEDRLLADAYRNSLQLAFKKNLKTVSFPNISTGVYRFPKERAAMIAVKTVMEFLDSHPEMESVCFVCFDEENYRCYQTLMK